MLSKEKMEQTINTAIVDTLVEQLALYLETRLKEHWDKIIFELATTRKSNYKLTEAFDRFTKSNKQIGDLLEHLQRTSQKTRALREKEDKLLSFLIKEFGMEMP